MFFAGMALGIVAGAAFGIGIMCCVVAGKQEDQQMEQMRIRRQKKGELKTIHFRDREGIERFSLSDGESLCMMAEDGTKEIGLCRFVDAFFGFERKRTRAAFHNGRIQKRLFPT